MKCKVVQNATIDGFERDVNECLAVGWSIHTCGIDKDRCWAVMVKK